ncbi:glycosyltransferase involved in cell wall biosynthesis [Paenibacillus endophyticus]|uniref:Glycosyltransferase involved in cell wall biosynthesis n=1 Tax=Paenibacillus endophyticus TaxID=1294268 RepID=A0A7W5C4Q5_9BACL|nr:glycosyltransferase [Paenibacillus endophyticus]MBB3150049.1 glycosyltransferase involved in cell wall biosynthesis [Paenibacillus endophyticus]
MKKNLLFIIPGLSAGGAERSLINLLTQLDFEKYHVDLFMFSPKGIFLELLPEQVKVLPLPETYSQFVKPILPAVSRLLWRRNAKLVYSRIMYSYKNRISGNTSVKEQESWKYISCSFATLEKKYDIAIAFLEKSSIYFCAEKVKADKKIGWVHNDYDMLGMNPHFDQNYFNKLDYIVTVSEECRLILQQRFPNQKEKVKVIYNIVSPTIIKGLANMVSEDVYSRKNDEIVILSIGRLHPQKGFEHALRAAKRLLDSGYLFQWNIIGEGEERAMLMELIDSLGLSNHVKLLGLRSNPYPYIKQADIYAQTSIYEGKAIAIDEAKILNKPIVITNFSTAKDQLEDGIEGLIVEMNAEAIASGISNLIHNTELRSRITRHLAELTLGTESEIEKLYQILG